MGFLQFQISPNVLTIKGGVQCNENYNSDESKIHHFRFHHPEQPREKLDDSFKEEVKLKLSIAASNSLFSWSYH